MVKTFQLLLLAHLSLGLFLTGFNQQDILVPVAFAEEQTPKGARKVIVPQDVKGHWKSVEISILDHKINAEKTYTIGIGETFLVPNTSLSLKVDTFLPAFIMDGDQMTSASNETRNPAAYVIIKEHEAQLFAGWLFSLYPDAHAFQDVRYNFNLTGYIPGTKN